MLKIIAAVAPPAILQSPTVHRHRTELFEFLRRTEDERRKRRAPINESFFFQAEICQAVAARWYKRCAYCEGEVRNPHAVHHFRPFRDARQLDDPVPEKDFYAWLAFEWDNLLWLCDSCAKAKATTFPTEGYRAPYLASLSETRDQETALLVDPILDEPSRHLRFYLTGDCEGITAKGRMTVRVLGLNRKELVGSRENSLRRLVNEWRMVLPTAGRKDLIDFVQLRQPHAGARIDVVRRLLRSMPEWAGVARGATAGFPNRLAGALEAADPKQRERLIEQMDVLRKKDSEAAAAARKSHDGPAAMSTALWAEVATPRRAAADRRLAQVTIRNFKGIETLDLKLDPSRRQHSGAPCLMLLGENAAGKSSTLAAMALALIGAREARRLRLKPAEFLRSASTQHWDQLEAAPLEVEIAFHASSTIASLRLDPVTEQIGGTTDPAAVVLGYGPRRYFDPRRYKRPSGASSRVRTLFDPLEVIPYPGTWLRGLSNAQFDVVARALREVLSLADNDELLRDLDGRISVHDGGRRTPVERLSEGYRSVFVMVVDIIREMMDHWANMEEAQGVVLIDEIETHLHPRWKMNVMGSLRRALPGIQFIVTTHDPLCLRGMDDGEVVVLKRDETGRTVQLKDLPSVKGMRAEQLLTSDYFGLSSTIDPETEREFAAYTSAITSAPDPDAASVDEAMAMVRELVLGDSAAETIIHEALRRFLSKRRASAHVSRRQLTEEAVETVLKAFEGIPGSDA